MLTIANSLPHMKCCARLHLKTSTILLGITHLKTCAQIIHCFGAVLIDEHHEFVQESVRLAIAADDRSPDRLIRGRAVRANPTIQVADFNLALVRDHGTFADDSCDATILALRESCRVRRGPQCRKQITGKDNVVNEKLYQHCLNILFQAASDGCETEVMGMRQLKVRKVAKRLRYFFQIVRTLRKQFAKMS